ncbi:MAG: LacI family DNA-binding transcriptional regulator [Candidatus Saccharibacteria bacterium]|nr:LacI family DNA-binding transcriptional regulator [Pseudorhodobacter sp.]
MEKRSKPGLEDIARTLGVSKMTVSRVLRGATGFSEATRDKVLTEVARTGYLPNRLAAAFGPAGSSTLIGVCVPRLTSPLFGSVLESINHTFARFGYQTMIGSHNQLPDEEEAWLRTLASWKPAAVVLASRNHSPGTMTLLRDMGVPVAEIWDLTTKPIDLAIGFSHFDNGFEMARCITAAGRRKIGYVGALGNRNTSGHLRYQGFVHGLNALGLSLRAEEILMDQPGFYAGYYGTETMMARQDRLDAIYYHDDEMAIGGLAYLTRIGLGVPDDIGIAGWGGMEAASILQRRLTTTAIPTTKLGKVAAEALVSRLRGDPVQDVTIIPTRLVPGSTI